MTDDKMVNIVIDGIKAEVPEGTTILQAAESLDIHVPTLCHHQALTPYGACRICLVEIESGGRKGLRTSCNNVVQEEMSIDTKCEKVLHSRKVIVELLLTRSPDSETIRELANEVGVEKSRFPKKDNECILCGLCVRMCEERMGKAAISFAGRGIEREVVPPFSLKTDVCQTCGACESICPTNSLHFMDFTVNEPKPLLSEFEVDLKKRSPVFIPFPQAMPNWATIDREHCVKLLNGDCGICKEVCEAKAIDYEKEDTVLDLDVGSVILAPGVDTFHARKKEEFGFGNMPNVVTSIQYERLLCASGPFGGHVIRPSDHEEPKRFAFLQCVGSRDMRCDREYCSSVCCTYATKEAILTREHCPDSEITIFGMDFRTHGKDFEKFMNRAQEESGVSYIRSRVPEIDEDPNTNNLILTFENEQGETLTEEFDLVILSVGLDIPEGIRDLARRIDVDLDEYGFVKTDLENPLDTTHPGVFVSGAFEAPKDIPETVMQASAAAAAAASILQDSRGTMVVKKEYPPERDVRYEEPRIGVFVCSCGSNIAGVVDVATVTEAAKSFPNVILAENSIYTCSQDALETIKERVEEHGLNRVVVASCSPRTHEGLFQENIREVGLNRYLFEMANIRDHCSWVHRDNPLLATAKAIDLVRGAVAKVRLSEPLASQFFEVNHSALVIGAGVAGMNAALSLAEQGFETFIVEKNSEVGGLSKRINHTIEGTDVSDYLKTLEEKINNNPLVTLFTETEVATVEGSVGHFTTTLKSKDTQIEHGIIIVATGGQELQTNEYGYGTHPGIMTQMELDERLDSLPDDLKDVFMIQCVGSRNEEYPNCSRICCAESVKNAIALQDAKPDCNVTILYRDLRTYGTMEKYYRLAREKGVLFCRYDADNPPVVSTDGSLSIKYRDPILKRDIESSAEAVVLSVGARPNENNPVLAPMLKVPLTEDGYFFEAHVKLRPVDFATDGVFVCGMAHGPKLIKEAAVQGLAAASRAATILSKEQMEALSVVSQVDPNACSGCKLCNTVCAYDGISFDGEKHVSVVNAAVCKGCGTCVANCPSGAITQLNFRDEQILAQISAIAGEMDAVERAKAGGEFEPKVLAFLCNWCSYAGADLAGISRSQYPPNIRVIRVMCSGRVSPLFVMKAMEEGFDGVWISGCHPGDCHYIEGNYHARRRWMAFKQILESTGMDMRRIAFSWVSASENKKFADIATNVINDIKELGPNKRFSDLSPAKISAPKYF